MFVVLTSLAHAHIRVSLLAYGFFGDVNTFLMYRQKEWYLQKGIYGNIRGFKMLLKSVWIMVCVLMIAYLNKLHHEDS